MNYVTFVSEQRENVIDVENKIQESAYKTEELYKRKDELMEKADQICQEDGQRDCRIQQVLLCFTFINSIQKVYLK